MFKLKQITYDISNVDADPFVEMVDGEFLTDRDAEAAAYNLAARYCEEYNETGNDNGDYFEVEEYEEFFGLDDDDYICHPVSVVWYDHAPDDRENDCSIRPVIGWDIV